MSRIKTLVPDTVNEFDEIDFEEQPVGIYISGLSSQVGKSIPFYIS